MTILNYSLQSNQILNKIHQRMNISFTIPSRNNLKYLKWSYASIRKNLKNQEHEICVADDFSDDGTSAWCEEMTKTDPHFKYIRNDGPTRLGHTILYDRLINEVATNDIVCIYHADMYACPNFDLQIEKHIKPGTVVSLTRIEPPLHPPGPEKITKDFGQEPEEFNPKEADFLTWFKSTRIERRDKVTEGIFAPWAIYKKDFQAVGGHDELFAPQSKEDSDVFNRFQLAGYKFVQTWEGCVYHMTCRGSRYNPTITTVGTESDEWLAQNNKSSRNFIRKWGCFVKHNDTMKPIVPGRYDVGFVVRNCDEYKLALLEPWCDTIYTDVMYDNYIRAEQKNTKFDLQKRLKRFEDQRTNDVIVEFDGDKLSNDSFEFFNMMSLMLDDSGQVGSMEYGIFTLTINTLGNHSSDLITIDNEWYGNKLIA
jgi:glycosyltransferase involved in cell wall biosynthesis